MPFPPLIDLQNGEETQLAHSSWLNYGGILLTDVLTEGYEENEVRTEDGAQRIAIHHVIKIMAIFNPAINGFVAQGAESPPLRAALGPTSSMLTIRDKLLRDRQVLRYAIAGTVVVESPEIDPDDGVRWTTDCYQGPKPLYAQVTQVSGTGLFYVRFGIECWTDPCQQTNLVTQSHRFSMVHDVDGDTWLTTRMVTGHMKFRPEWLENIGQVPDQIKILRGADGIKESNFLWHPVPPGFKRQSVRVQAHPNGMELAYSFVDTEQVLPLGSLSPATKLTAEFSIGSSIAEGKPALSQAAVHVSALGPKNQFRMNLLIMAMKIALRKLQKPGLQLVNEIMVTYSLDNKFVDLSMKGIWKPVGIGMEGLQIADTGLEAASDMADLDGALEIFRALGEAAQGSQSHLSRGPLLNFGSKGTYTGLCIGSSLVTGCFILGQPKNGFLGLNNEKVAQFEGDAENIIPPLTSNDLGELPFSLQVTDALTIQLLSTGLSYEITEGVGLYEDWQQATRYHTNHQKAVLPVGAKQAGSPGDDEYSAPQVASLGLPYTFVAMDYTVAWIGPGADSIILPSPDTGDPNLVFLCEDINYSAPSAVNSSSKAWRVSGTYWYVSKLLRTSSLTAKAQFDYTDEGFSPGRGITDPQARSANTIGLARFTAGYSPSFVG